MDWEYSSGNPRVAGRTNDLERSILHSGCPQIGLELWIAMVYSAAAWMIFGYRLRVIRERGSFELI
jgi:hypothetical protein